MFVLNLSKWLGVKIEYCPNPLQGVAYVAYVVWYPVKISRVRGKGRLGHLYFAHRWF